MLKRSNTWRSTNLDNEIIEGMQDILQSTKHGGEHVDHIVLQSEAVLKDANREGQDNRNQNRRSCLKIN